ncbi:GFA family protein [Ferrimonas balearica]|uniref:GFA family protein n=1 Tax=Ferrimonas balearica TaxID=44012 RepID=UPI001C99AC5F|nr:GFA family protein [Ferrimonas balearica]MBY5991329.1 GFA family protein [Ferrimonas balearica]
MSLYHVSCSCGQVRLDIDAEPIRLSVCHCHECQKRTGSAFGYQARFAESAVRVTGPTQSYSRTGDSGGQVSQRFCPHCGTTVLLAPEALKGFVAVPAGLFTQTPLPAPTVSVYEARQHGWVAFDTELEHME